MINKYTNLVIPNSSCETLQLSNNNDSNFHILGFKYIKDNFIYSGTYLPQYISLNLIKEFKIASFYDSYLELEINILNKLENSNEEFFLYLNNKLISFEDGIQRIVFLDKSFIEESKYKSLNYPRIIVEENQEIRLKYLEILPEESVKLSILYNRYNSENIYNKILIKKFKLKGSNDGGTTECTECPIVSK